MEHPNLPTLQHESVYIDVYAWIRAIETHKRVVIEGVFRHAVALCELYQPAVYLTADETISPFGLAVFERFTNKTLTVFRTVNEIADAGARVWVSLAVDFPAPFLHLKTKFKKLAILHDTLAGEGVFGKEKQEQFVYGGRNNDMFAYVSVSTLHRFVKAQRFLHLNPQLEFVKYGCFHQLTMLPDLSVPRDLTKGLAVHSLYRRKNIEDTSRLALRLGINLTHVGQVYDESPELLESLSVHVKFLGALEDFQLDAQYQSTGSFICLSTDEGFSMPPMEAILYGVPFVYLSDISAHREVYGNYDVNFVPVPLRDFSVTHSKTISEMDRHSLFIRYSKKEVMRDLVEVLSHI